MSAPRLANDCFALPPGVHWTPVDEALDLLRSRMTPVTGSEDVPLARASRRILQQDLVAPRDNPPLPNAAVDGYAYAHGADGAAGLDLVDGRAAAGHPHDKPVPPGHAIRILTGAPLPDGVDTVVMQEDVTATDRRITFGRGLKRGENARDAGEDIKAGQVALAAGRLLAPQDIAQAAALGVAGLSVRKRLRVGVLSTGDELVQPGLPAPHGGIYDANRPMLMALAERLGFEVVDLGVAADRPAAIHAALDRGAAEADAIITSGGASGGDEDHVARALNETGAMNLWRIAVKPGRPLALGLWRGAPVFGLPGNPVAAFVCFLIFARPALSALAGAQWPALQRVSAPAAFRMSKKDGRREFLRGRLNAQGQVEKFRSTGSGLISGLRWADGLIDLPEPGAEIEPGDPVQFITYASLGL